MYGMKTFHGQWLLVDIFFSKWANSSGHFQRVNSSGLIEVLHTCNELVSKNESSIRNVWSKLLQIITAATFGWIPTTESKGLIQLSKICPNVSTTPIMAMGCRQCLPLTVSKILSVTGLRWPHRVRIISKVNYKMGIDPPL